tara:strand:- start:123 stop:392 length:270 start_codon:yes stop_codon:yes gene_type:complete
LKTKPKAILMSTPEFADVWINKMYEYQQGLYYRVKDKLNKLQKAMSYPNQGNPDNRIIEGILIKFERDNKISGEDMEICNSLWRKYGKK